jgi:hypothetical protein
MDKRAWLGELGDGGGEQVTRPVEEWGLQDAALDDVLQMWRGGLAPALGRR